MINSYLFVKIADTDCSPVPGPWWKTPRGRAGPARFPSLRRTAFSGFPAVCPNCRRAGPVRPTSPANSVSPRTADRRTAGRRTRRCGPGVAMTRNARSVSHADLLSVRIGVVRRGERKKLTAARVLRGQPDLRTRFPLQFLHCAHMVVMAVRQQDMRQPRALLLQQPQIFLRPGSRIDGQRPGRFPPPAETCWCTAAAPREYGIFSYPSPSFFRRHAALSASIRRCRSRWSQGRRWSVSPSYRHRIHPSPHGPGLFFAARPRMLHTPPPKAAALPRR